MYSPEKDRAYYEAGFEELERYLLSNELYWPSRAHTADLTQLTLGGLLLARARLRGSKAAGLERLDAQLDAIRSKWRSAWDGKARREVHARSVLWHDYLSEVRADPAGAARQYPQNVRQRAILALLGEQSDLMDSYLRGVLSSGSFVWDAALQDGFPRAEFWFLYGSLKPKEST